MFYCSPNVGFLQGVGWAGRAGRHNLREGRSGGLDVALYAAVKAQAEAEGMLSGTGSSAR